MASRRKRAGEETIGRREGGKAGRPEGWFVYVRSMMGYTNGNMAQWGILDEDWRIIWVIRHQEPRGIVHQAQLYYDSPPCQIHLGLRIAPPSALSTPSSPLSTLRPRHTDHPPQQATQPRIHTQMSARRMDRTAGAGVFHMGKAGD